jgi:hypothetical protein
MVEGPEISIITLAWPGLESRLAFRIVGHSPRRSLTGDWCHLQYRCRSGTMHRPLGNQDRGTGDYERAMLRILWNEGFVRSSSALNGPQGMIRQGSVIVGSPHVFGQVALLLLFDTAVVPAQTPNHPGDTRNKHEYCVVRRQGTAPPVCQNCSAQIGGEGGKVICHYRFGQGSVRYGRCDEPRNRPPC